jgi:hypothetical protein
MKINVTENHIKNGVPENCHLCAVSLAIAEALRNLGTYIGLDSIEISTDHTRDSGYRFRIKTLHSKDVYSGSDYTISDSDRDRVDSFIKEFDKFGYDEEKQQSYPTSDIINAKPFTFELGGEVAGQNSV